MDTFKEIIKTSLSENTENECVWNDYVHPYAFQVFNEIVRKTTLLADLFRIDQVNELVDLVKFIDEMLCLLAKKTNNFKKYPLKYHQI